MAEREFNPYPERLTEVLSPDVVQVLVTGYCTLTRSPISILEREGGEPIYVDPQLVRNPVCKIADERAREVCNKCDRFYVDQVFEAGIKRITPYLCPFGQVDVAIPVLIGARTVAVFFGGQVPFHYWPPDTQEDMIKRAIQDGYLDKEPEDASQAGREAMMLTLKQSRIMDVDVDKLMAAADAYMKEEKREEHMGEYVAQLKRTAGIIQNLGNEKYFADSLPHLSSLIEGGERPESSQDAEQELWEGVLRAVGVVRRSMGFESAVIFGNSEDAPNLFQFMKSIGLPETMHRYTEKHKGPLRLNANMVAAVAAARETPPGNSSARDSLFRRVRKWLPGSGIEPLSVTVVDIGHDARRYAILVLCGTDARARGVEHASQREEMWLERLLRQVADSMERRSASIALRHQADMQESFAMDLTHELKAPFQSILAQAQRLMRLARAGRIPGPVIEQAGRRVSAEQREVHTRMENVSILASRDPSELDKQPRRLEPVVEGSVERYREIAAERDITIRSSLSSDDGDFCLVDIDAESLELAVDNLIQNAVKYSYAGTEVSVETASTSASAVLQVTNVGARIPSEKYEEVFKRYVRLSSRETQFDFRPGTGIGLAVVHTVVVTLHGGKVSVESVKAPASICPPEHEGAQPWRTRFTVELPRYRPSGGMSNGYGVVR